MNTVYLILGHYEAEQLGRLVTCLDESPIYVHIDAKVDIKPFIKTTQHNSSVRFIRKRVDAKWGGWSIVEATLNLLEEAAPHLHPEDYVILLSGDSFPLQSQNEIHSYLAERRGMQFINMTTMPSTKAHKPITRISRLYIEYNPRNGRLNLIPKAINKTGIPRNYRRAINGRTPYAGSTWWALTAEATLWMLKEARMNMQLTNFYKRTRVPDESFFHTLLGNSPFSNAITQSITFADWSRPWGPKPATIDEEHIHHLTENGLRVNHLGYGESTALFVRKVTDAIVCEQIKERAWPVQI